MLIAVKVVPNASRDKIVGELDGALKVSVTAAPERGSANKAVCKLLAGTLKVRTQQVTVDAGQTSPRKARRITDISLDDVKERLPPAGLRQVSPSVRRTGGGLRLRLDGTETVHLVPPGGRIISPISLIASACSRINQW